MMNCLSRSFGRLHFTVIVLLALGLQPGTAALAESESEFRDAVVANCKYLWGYSEARLSCPNSTITGMLNYSENCTISTQCSVGSTVTQNFQVSGTFDQHDFDDLVLCGTAELRVGQCLSANPDPADVGGFGSF